MGIEGMRTLFKTAVTVALGLTGMVAACEDAFGPGRSIVLPITDLVTPAEVRPNDVLVVKVSIQTGGCKSLVGLNAVRTEARVTLTARGSDSSGENVNCPGDIRTEVREYRAEPPFGDPFTVVGNQPDGSTTTRTVRVR
jgi:hypothetical protein